MQSEEKLIWRSPEEIVDIGFQHSSVVMMNEAHSGLQRCIRTRQIGQRILPVAHQAGVRHLAMEALNAPFADRANQSRVVPDSGQGYLSQPEMRSFIQTALELGWTLVPYEFDRFKWLYEKHGIDLSNANETENYHRWQEFQPELTTLEFTNWREEQQALNLIAARKSLPDSTPLLVWCGNNHHSKKTGESWIPMGYQFQQHSGINPFVIDQIGTVKFHGIDTPLYEEFVKPAREMLEQMGGTAGLLREESINVFLNDSEDAFLFSTRNELE
jgi:hypothetical protein